jgi:uncharacterized membrane protein YqjE
MKLNNYKRLELTTVKQLIEQMNTNNEVNTKLHETRVTLEEQRNIILSVILMFAYTSMYFIFILILFNHLIIL